MITLRNLEEHEIRFPDRPRADSPEFSYKIVVRNAAGKAVDLTPYGREARERRGRKDERWISAAGRGCGVDGASWEAGEFEEAR